MKPFSALYFIKENKIRCMLLVFMIFLGYAAYLGGLYATNVRDGWKLPFKYIDKMALVSFDGTQEEEIEKLEAFERKTDHDGRIKMLPVSRQNSLNWKTIMGFEIGQYAYTFASVEDFKVYCAYMGVDCDFDKLKNGSMIMSGKMSRNKDMKVGDKIGRSDVETIFGEFTLDALTEEDGYTIYFIDKKLSANDSVMLLSDELDGKGLKNYALEEYGSYEDENLKESIDNQFDFLYSIYVFIVLLMALILAVTICAAFVGMYQRRNFEFAVYRAIGISKQRIIGKISGELLWMDFAAIAAGGIIFFLGLYLFNNMVLYPKGQYLCYFHPLALSGMGLCNIMVVIPLIVTRCRQMLKADICEY